jgi:putative oxidoreductase
MQITNTSGPSPTPAKVSSVKGYKSKSIAGSWALFLLRLVVGYGFLAHGLAKLNRGPFIFAGILRNLGVPSPMLSAWLTIATEILGGVAMLVGLFVVWASIPMALVLLAAAMTVHLQYGFSSIRLLAVSSSGATFGPVGYELDLLYLTALCTLALAGPGTAAVDNCRRKNAKSA